VFLIKNNPTAWGMIFEVLLSLVILMEEKSWIISLAFAFSSFD
jgi:hypothetical protein